MDDASPCAEGRALFAAKLAYLEAKISPEPSQEEAWRTFANAMRASAGAVDRACVEDPPRPLSADAGERLKRMERHAAAMQAMFGAMADAYVAIAPNLTEAQRDILSRNIVPSRPFGPVFLAEKSSPRRHGPELRPGRAGIPRLSAASGSFAVLISLKSERSAHGLADVEQRRHPKGRTSRRARAEKMLVCVAGHADREVLDDLSGGGLDRRCRRIPAVNVIKASLRLVSTLFTGIIQSNWGISGADLAPRATHATGAGCQARYGGNAGRQSSFSFLRKLTQWRGGLFPGTRST